MSNDFAMDHTLQAWGVDDPELRLAAIKAVEDKLLSSVELASLQYVPDAEVKLRALLARVELRRQPAAVTVVPGLAKITFKLNGIVVR